MTNELGPVERAFRAERHRCKLSQRDVAAVIGVRQSIINHVENGRYPMPRRWVALLPEGMRPQVARALIEEHEAAIAMLIGLAA